MKFALRFVIPLVFGLAIYPFPTHVARENRTAAASLVVAQEDECEKAHPWQHKVDGKCVDKPHVTHYHGDHNPGEGEECWIECLCYEGQAPSGNGCGSCSYVGTVCIRH
jgi:hypothetical protein